MNSPSYYYQHQSQHQLNNQEIDSLSEDDSSQSDFSQQQEYEIYNNQIIPQSNKIASIHQKPILNSSDSNLKSLHKNNTSHFAQSKDQQINLFYQNQDRSLKVNQTNKKSQNFTNKNKSLSSPSNNLQQSKFSKKNKKVKETQNNDKNPINKPHISKKKNKNQKQKKISNGSLSTNNTKTINSINTKLKKQSKKEAQKGQHNLTKSSHNVSQQSNQFLVLGQNLYDYQDMSRVITAKQFYDRKAFINELEKQRNKKVRFGECDRSFNGKNNLNDHSLSIYDPARLQKKVNKTISKIQRYIMGFLQAEVYQLAKQEALEDTENLSIQKKIQLYHQLMKDTQLSKEIQTVKKINESQKIDEIIKLSIEKVQKKSEKLSQMYHQQSGLISKWKNSKLHQLSTAKKILQRLMEEDHSKTNSINKLSYSNQIDHSSRNNQLQEIQDIESDPLYILEKELQLIMNEDYYPQLKKQTLNLRKSLNQLLKNQHFPQPKATSQTQVVEQSRMQNTQNYFTPNGVLWFFDKFFTFITEKQNYIPELVQKLNQGFGFDVETKKVIAKTKDYEKWFDFFGEGQNSVNHKSLIDSVTFNEFQEAVIKPDPQLTPEMQKYMHYFNKAIIDSFNEQFHRFRPFYPNGEPIPNIQKPGKYFEITNESIFYFFQKSKYHIYTDYITFFGGLILPEGQQETKQTKQYNVSKEIKLVNSQLSYDWEFYHCLLPVAKLATFEELYQDIEKEIFDELANDLIKISKKR